jgi:predicted ester cyclase
MSIERNKDVVRRLLTAHFRDDRDGVAEILSPKLTWHMAGETKVMGRPDYLEGLEMGAKAFADKSQTIQQMIAEGDKVAVLATVRMRHAGEFIGIPATDRTVEFASMWMYRVVDDKVVEIWAFDEDFTQKLRS